MQRLEHYVIIMYCVLFFFHLQVSPYLSVLITSVISKRSIILYNLFVLHFCLISLCCVTSVFYICLPGLSLQVCNDKLCACFLMYVPSTSVADIVA